MDDQLTDILQFLAYGELADIFHVADSLTSLYYDNKNYCGEFMILATLRHTCTNEEGKEGGGCKFMTLFHNLFVTNNIAALGALSVLANQIGHFHLSVEKD